MSLRRPQVALGLTPYGAARMSRSLSGKNGQKIAGHANEGMTKNYQRDHEESSGPRRFVGRFYVWHR